VNASTVAFVCALIWTHDELTPILQEHLDDQHGEILPHLLMADVERWSEEQIRLDPQGGPALRAVLDFIERAQTPQVRPEVSGLIMVSFIEHLPMLDEPGSELRRFLGPKTLAAFEALE
jgi:hypothetical protein